MHPITVVVVDDDADIRLALAEALEMEGYSIRLAANGLEAIEIVAELGVERCVVLLDMCMPQTSGEEVLQILRNEGQLPALPVIVLSATRPTEATTAGARFCLNKPIELEDLLRALESLFGELRAADASSQARLRVKPTDRQDSVARDTCNANVDAEPAARRRGH